MDSEMEAYPQWTPVPTTSFLNMVKLDKWIIPFVQFKKNTLFSIISPNLNK